MKLTTILFASLFVCLIVILGVKGYRQYKRPAFESMNNAEFARILAEPGVQVVDVRTPGEFAEGHIPGAVNIDVRGADFDRRIRTLDRDRPVAVYCRSGSRSKVAASTLSEAGFKVFDLDRGIINWDGATER